MTTTEMPDHGDPGNWIELSGKENRCLLGLKNYYTIFEEKALEQATELAWKDLKKEVNRKTGKLAFSHLENATWFK
jgi:hypothetical protein